MSTTQARFLLIAVFAARGVSFLFSKELLTALSPMSVMAVRFLLAFAILAVVFRRKLRACDRAALRGGLILGVLYSVVVVFELNALKRLDSGVTALIENMAIVLVPVAAAALARTLPGRKTVFCALLAVAGVGFLSLSQSGGEGSGLGVLLAVLAALTYTACILTTERVSRNADPVVIGVIQLGTMGVAGLAASLFSGGVALPQTGRQWVLMLLLVLVCSCFGFTYQPVAQKYLPVEDAASLIVFNPLTASLTGVLLGSESITVPKIVGYVLILASLLLHSARPRRSGQISS